VVRNLWGPIWPDYVRTRKCGHGSLMFLNVAFFTARRYASALYAVALCLSMFVTIRYCIETAGWIKLVFGEEAFPKLCWKRMRVSPEIRVHVLPSGTLSQTLKFADFFCFFRHCTSIVASVVNLVRPTNITERPPLFTTRDDVKVRLHLMRCVALRHRAARCVVFVAYRKIPHRNATHPM